jgi:tetratricopeptide (TPR) repeat protein
MDALEGHGKLLSGLLLALTLTCAAPDSFPQAALLQGRNDAVAGLGHPEPGVRAGAIAWIAEHGRMADQPLLLARLRDADEDVRGIAEQGLWRLWSRSGEPAVDRLLESGIEQMQAGRFGEAVATFSEVIRRKPGFAEGWNKRATAHYLAGDFPRSMKDCDEVLKRNPNHFGALSGYGQIHFRLEHYEKAIEFWRRALRVNPNMPGVEINIDGVEQLLKEKRARSA